MFVVHVGPAVVRAVGKPVIRLFRSVPVIFGVVCLAGIAVGVFLMRMDLADEPHPMFFRTLGVGVAVFYLGVGVLWLVKVCQHTWRDFCDWWIAVLDSLPGDA